MRSFVLGILVAIVLMLAGGYLAVAQGWVPAGQDVKPGKAEKLVAKTLLRAAIRREAQSLTNPVAASDENLAAGIALYVVHCQSCHGGPNGSPSVIAKGLSPDPPQLAKHGVEDDPDGTNYWKVTHGIRFTGMPAFGQTLSDKERWQISVFLKHMDSLPPAARNAWAAGRSQ
jgi:thiosulfate dehydrogenase